MRDSKKGEYTLNINRPRPSGAVLWASTGQWTLFILANLLVIPIVVGHTYHLSEVQISYLLQRTLILTGLLSWLQSWLSHRLPMIEGPSGLWLSVFLAIGLSVGPHPAALHAALASLRLGLILSGIVSALFAWLGLVGRIRKLFTPLVTGVYLILLSIQLSNVFLAGIVSPDGVFSASIFLADLALMALVIWISIKGPPRLRPFGVLAGLIVGWALFLVLHWTPAPAWQAHLWNWPFASHWGLRWNTGIVLTCLITGFINITNTIASLHAVSDSYEQLGRPLPPDPRRYDRTSLGSALGNILAGFASAVGVITFSISAGFVQMTRDPNRRPFMAASLAMMGLGFIPAMTSLLADIPLSVGDAVLLVTYVQMLGMGLSNLSQTRLSTQSIYRAGIPLLFGIGLSAIPSSAFATIPATFRILAENGLVVGVILAILLELVPWPDMKAAQG